MQVGETVCPQDRLHLLSEKRKWQSELENKRRQLEDDRRALQHMKMKAVREQWLLDGAASSGALDQDQARTRSLEETITRLENDLLHLEAGGVSSGTLPAVEVKGRDDFEDDAPIPGFAEVNVNKSLMMKTPNEVEQLKRAMYSVEITVERDRVTGETRVLSTNTILPVDLSHQGVVVYEDERKVVHEMNGEDGVQPLSSSEVEQLIHKADEAFMMSPTSSMAASPPTVEVQEEAAPQLMPPVPVEATRLETSVDLQLSAAEASDENPVTMVFMGYQNVEDEDETKKVLGLQEMVKAELVLINDATTPSDEGKEEISLLPPALPRPPKPVEAEPPAQAAPEPEQPRAGATELKKEKRLCICCSIM